MSDVQVHSGEYQFALRQSMWLQTVVGTCVIVCIWDEENQSGGMCHYRLPVAPEAITMGEHANDYGTCAIPNLLKKFKHSSSKLANLRTWVLGGGQVHDGAFMQSQQIGERNVLVALDILAQYGLPIVGASVGGSSGRQIRFNPKSGVVDFRFLDDTPRDAESAESALGSRAQWVYVVSASETFFTLIEKTLGTDPSIHLHVLPDLESVSRYFSHQAPQALIIDAQNLPTTSLVFTSLPAMFTPLNLPTVVVADGVTALNGTHYRTLVSVVGNRILVSTPQCLVKVLASAIHLNTLSTPLKTQLAALPSTHPSNNRKGKPTGVVLIGSSTGGVDALDVLLTQFPGDMPPICIAQHIPQDYSMALVERLNTKTPLTVKEAVDGEVLTQSHVYFAPGNHHIKLVQLSDGNVVVRATLDPPINSFRPSVDYLFDSATKIKGLHIVAALLTGMGSDGAKGLHHLKHQGAFTLVQDEKSCVVYGMGRVAKELGAVCRTVPIHEMARAIIEAYQGAFASELSHGKTDELTKELR
ncbi:hypothetical protein A1OO_13170 [Enterovibrio norvegicus FF-33]|uniref:chemotaxis protein CheB n=1 Tax=Enterovibrio norvegicus TaxID=188144 RepID=UPI00031374BA|nr:chemotaxis protein CheB [Enterovibrio norvegicus]OEE66715.1 hypothetical protein A1OO_13170 [Enterovibrio norvegicus FF-33]